MASISELLGEKLLSGKNEVATQDAIAGKKAVALYFSAHWCPPCRGFTPQLAKWYAEDLSAKGLEVVFISSDKTEDAFKEYYEEQPWKALPYADRQRKDALSKKYKVEGIPSLVVLDAEGKLINKDGRAAVSSDPKGEDFPWKPKTLHEILSTAKLLGKDGPVDPSVLKDRVFALYFSAHWCPPCRGFTPKLAEMYTDSFKDKGLEIVFVSSDREEGQFKEYYGEQPWLALDFACRKEKQALSELYGVEGIPSLVIVDKDGSTITKDGRAAVSSDPKGDGFPWYPKPVSDLALGPGRINEAPMVLMMCEAAAPGAKAAAEAAAEPVAKRFIATAKAAGEEPEIDFAIAKASNGITAQIRSLTGLPEAGSEGDALPKVVLINVPDDGAYFDGPEGEVTTEALEAFVAAFQGGTLERKQLKS